MVHVVLAGGGTAGHTSPLIATTDALRRLDPDGTLVAIGTPKGLETTVIPEAGLDLELIPPVPLPRRPTLDLVKVPFRLNDAVGKAAAVLRRERADVVVGFGGYVSLPAYLAARRLRIPVVLHEQNALPGLANKVAARFTEHVYTAFPDTALPHAQFIGMPLRPGIAQLDRTERQPAARHVFGLTAKAPTLLVSGGSQGARSINTATIEARASLLAAGVQVLHVLGRRDFTEDMVSVYDEETGVGYHPVPYVSAMEDAYAAADLMLGRSGAGTVHETAVVGLPALFVPLPHGNGEQARNADALVAAGAVRLVADAELTAPRLLDEVLPVITDAATLARMSHAQRSLVPGDAAERLARVVLQVGRAHAAG